MSSRNAYRFSLLKQKTVIDSPIDRTRIFHAMRQARDDLGAGRIIDSLAALESALIEGEYYLAHDLVRWKGRQWFFDGELCLTTRGPLLAFLSASMDADDMRNLMFCPCLPAPPDLLFEASEDGCFRRYGQT